MPEGLSSTHKIVTSVIVVAGVAGWIFGFVQMGAANSLKSELEPAQQSLEAAQAEVAKLQSDLGAAQSARSELEQQIEAGKSLAELSAELEAGNAELTSVRSDVESAQAELESLSAKVQKQQALLEGSVLRFKTTARARVRAGPGTDTEEVAVVPSGKTLQVFEIVEDGTWYKVGGMGYVFHELLEPVEKKLEE